MRRRILLLAAMLAFTAQAEVYKCRMGERTVYQEMPCARPEQARSIAERMTVVDSYPYRLAPRPVEAEPAVRPDTATASAGGEHPSCQSLRDRIRKIDTAARHRSTPSLTERRRTAKQKLSALACSEMDPR